MSLIRNRREWHNETVYDERVDSYSFLYFFLRFCLTKVLRVGSTVTEVPGNGFSLVGDEVRPNVLGGSGVTHRNWTT